MSDRILVDAKNTFCPGPLMELISNMKMAEVGDELELLSTDEGSAADIPEWINKVGHEIIDSFKEEEVLHIVVKKIKQIYHQEYRNAYISSWWRNGRNNSCK